MMLASMSNPMVFEPFASVLFVKPSTDCLFFPMLDMMKSGVLELELVACWNELGPFTPLYANDVRVGTLLLASKYMIASSPLYPLGLGPGLNTSQKPFEAFGLLAEPMLKFQVSRLVTLLNVLEIELRVPTPSYEPPWDLFQLKE